MLNAIKSVSMVQNRTHA